jgi:hypothetical protein
MPSAPDYLCEKIIKRFGSIDCGPPLAWLKARGFKETAGLIFAPHEDYDINREEGDCIDFLFMEWDFGFGG